MRQSFVRMKYEEESMEGQNGRPTMSIKFPYRVSFSFGLIYVSPHAHKKDKRFMSLSKTS